MDWELIQQWVTISMITGMIFLCGSVLFFFLFDLCRKRVVWSDIKTAFKEIAITLAVLPVIFTAVCSLIIFWPVVAFFALRDLFRERGIT